MSFDDDHVERMAEIREKLASSGQKVSAGSSSGVKHAKAITDPKIPDPAGIRMLVWDLHND